MTAYEQANMLNPNYPQDRYYTQLYNEQAITSYNLTNFVQVMATATKVIVDGNTQHEVGDFSILYTPMNTGEYL